MADINITITIPDAYVSRVAQAFTGYANTNLTFRDEGAEIGFSYAPKGSDTNQAFAKRVIRSLILAMVRCYELDQDYTRYRTDISAVTPPSQDVPDGVVL